MDNTVLSRLPATNRFRVLDPFEGYCVDIEFKRIAHGAFFSEDLEGKGEFGNFITVKFRHFDNTFVKIKYFENSQAY